GATAATTPSLLLQRSGTALSGGNAQGLSIRGTVASEAVGSVTFNPFTITPGTATACTPAITGSLVVNTINSTLTATAWGKNTNSLGEVDTYSLLKNAELANGFVVKLNVSADSTIVRIAGTPNVMGDTGDNGPALNAQMEDPRNLVVDPVGNVYFSDSAAHR